ncbi:uncharacterized protein PAC_01152 [Phialocephala subalpina]|uniref:DUF6594 domain-containing protein n=1 Tax=Phialocephala subalpina TaxID=576137 RepID=A0A1L7WES4_9HELO|nr:uncharacterized protein PAC_01152 [Phialocephala subalpina]
MASEGYAKIATLMSHHSELAIFRRFNKLNLQNLLYLQAELTHLEDELNCLAERDKDDPNRRFHSKDWWSLAVSSNEEDESSGEQWEKVLDIREKLKEYNDYLAQQVFLSNQQPPKAYDLNFFTGWLKRSKWGNNPLRGLDHDTWSSPRNSHDLIAIQRRSSTDPFSQWLCNKIIPCLHRKFLGRFKKPMADDPESQICNYREGRIAKTMDVLSTVIASMLPITSIVILYFVSNTLDRLGIAVAFTGLFALCLVMTTRARRVEIFAATSA